MGRKSRQKLQKRIDRRLRELSDAQREGFVNHVLTSPLENLSREERVQLFRDLGSEAKQRFYTAFTEVRSQILEFDPLLALSVLSAYGQFGPFGHDSEIHGENMIGQAHIELLQAIMLQRELTSFQHQPLPSSEVFKLHEQVAEIVPSTSSKRVG